MTARSEYTRQLVHMAMGGFAFALRFLTWWQAALLAGSAVLFNLFVLPHVGGQRLYRSSEFARGFPAGILLYPISVLLLILIFPRRLDIAAAAWAILAVGDGMSTIIGRAVGERPIPWNREKTWAGSAAFVAFGSLAGVALAWWCSDRVQPVPSPWFWIAAPIAAALCAAAAESIPIRLDDNVSVPAAAAAVLWLASLLSEDAARAAVGVLATRLPLAIGLNTVVALAGYRANTVSQSGAICGAVIGTIIFTATGWRGWTLLLGTFLSAAITSRLGLRRKTLLGIAEERGGRRRAANAMANTSVAAAAAVVALLSPSASMALIAFAAALTAGGSDTVASEIGKAWGRSVITGLARLDGWPVAVLASDPSYLGGSWDAKTSEKAERFVKLADQFRLPIVHLVDNPGFMIGGEAERTGTIRYGVQAMNAIYRATVPLASVVVRRAYGIAGSAMSNAERFQYRFAWPSGDWGSLPIEGGVEVAGPAA